MSGDSYFDVPIENLLTTIFSARKDGPRTDTGGGVSIMGINKPGQFNIKTKYPRDDPGYDPVIMSVYTKSELNGIIGSISKAGVGEYDTGVLFDLTRCSPLKYDDLKAVGDLTIKLGGKVSLKI